MIFPMSDSETSAAEAIWAWAVLHGRVPSIYGRVDKHRTAKVHAHMTLCAPSVEKSTVPDFGSAQAFVNTFDGNAETPAVLGQLVCECGSVNEEWEVVTESGERPTLTEIILGITGA